MFTNVPTHFFLQECKPHPKSYSLLCRKIYNGAHFILPFQILSFDLTSTFQCPPCAVVCFHSTPFHLLNRKVLMFQTEMTNIHEEWIQIQSKCTFLHLSKPTHELSQAINRRRRRRLLSVNPYLFSQIATLAMGVTEKCQEFLVA